MTEARSTRRRASSPRAKTPCVTSSFQAECVVLVHMLHEMAPDIPVLFLDTVHHFPQTHRLSRRAVRALEAESGHAARGRAGSRACGNSDTKACCGKHKVEPLFGALANYDVWFTGLRRAQSASRAALEEVEPFRLPDGQGAPQGQPARRRGRRRMSGRTPRRTTFRCCRSTSSATPASAASRARRCRVDPSDDRSGRWQGQKLECGIHIQS